MKLPLPSWRPKVRIRLCTEFFGALLGVSAVIAFLVLPTINSISYLHASIAQEYRQMQVRYAEGHTLRTLTKQVREVKDVLPTLKTMFYDPRNPLERIQGLENLAKEAGLEGQIAVTLPKGNEKTLILEMRTRGSWANTERFFQELDRAALYVLVDRLSLTGSGGNVSATLLVRLTPLAETDLKL